MKGHPETARHCGENYPSDDHIVRVEDCAIGDHQAGDSARIAYEDHFELNDFQSARLIVIVSPLFNSIRN